MEVLNLHPWRVSPSEAIKIQRNLIKRIKFKKVIKEKIRKIAGCDAYVKNDKIYGVVCIFSYPELKLLEIVKRNNKVFFPYIPGLLSFREGPILANCFRVVKIEPDLIIFDGQGIAHPRYMGLATHMGIILNKPTIGCAKKLLIGNYNNLGKEKGKFEFLKNDKREIVGAVLRTRENVKPVFVSCGYRIDLFTAIEITLSLCKKYRIPEPLRIAHMEAKKFQS